MPSENNDSAKLTIYRGELDRLNDKASLIDEIYPASATEIRKICNRIENRAAISSAPEIIFSKAWAMPSAKVKENQILLTFKDKEEVDYILLYCRRKGYRIPNYILDNIEWDDHLACFSLEPDEPITSETCRGCDFDDTCPDVVKEPIIHPCIFNKSGTCTKKCKGESNRKCRFSEAEFLRCLNAERRSSKNPNVGIHGGEAME